LSGLNVCGDHRDSSTVQGALASGRRAARAVLSDFGAPPAAGSDTNAGNAGTGSVPVAAA
ncbi:oxidoreductase, partial [Streptomyces antimycoticus]